MTSNTLQALRTNDLIQMRAKAYKQIWAEVAQGLLNDAAVTEARFLRYDDELATRGFGGYSPSNGR